MTVSPRSGLPKLVVSEEQMKNWKFGILVLASVVVLIGAGAEGRAAIWAAPEGDGQLQSPDSTDATALVGQPTADAQGATGAPTESRRSR